MGDALQGTEPQISGRIAGWNGEGLDPQTAAWIEDFAKQPPRENQGLDDLRASYRQTLIQGSVAADPAVIVEPLELAGAAGPLAGRLYKPPRVSTPGPLILYVHGGGFAVGDLDSHDSLARLISAASGSRVLTIDYRRAPEAAFPAARDDTVAAFRWAIAHAADLGIDASRIALAGESAGAAHAVASAQLLKTESVAPKLVWVMSPALDATTAGESYRKFAHGAGRTAAEFAYLWSLYVPDEQQRSSPDVSPVLGNLKGLPPLFVYPAEFDPAHDDGISFAARAEAADVSVVLRVRAGLVHQYPEITAISEASRFAVVEAAKEVGAALEHS